MALALDDAILGWLVASAADGLARWLRGRPARAAMRTVVEEAVEASVVEAAGHLDDSEAEHLRGSLLVRDLAFNIDFVGVAKPTELRDALHAWTKALNRPEFGDAGYLGELGVDPYRLADALTSQVAGGIQRNGRSGGALSMLAEWLWRDDTTARLERLEEKLEDTITPSQSYRGALPGRTPYFTGRDAALAELNRRVEGHDPAGSVVVIHAIDGMPGVGKTALALQAAHQHKGGYPDGQFFLDLHGYTSGVTSMAPEAALEELLRQAGMPGQAIPPDLARRQARWRSLMAGRRALVVLDNARDVAQVQPLLPTSAGCLVLVTSRTRLTGLSGARALPLDVLPAHEAVELFIRLAGADRCPDRAPVAQLVELVGGLPLAIEIVAGRMRGEPTLTPAELITELSEANSVLDETSPQDVGVRAALEVSVQRLDQRHRRALRALGLYPGTTIGVPQFAAIAGMPPAEGGRMLRELAERNLLRTAGQRVGHRRYKLHELVREFVNEQARSHVFPDGRSTAIGRLTAWYATALDVVNSLWDATGDVPAARATAEGLHLDDAGQARTWMLAEQDNLVAFAELAAGVDAAEVLRRSASCLYLLDNYTGARVLNYAAADICGQLDDPDGEADGLVGLGQAAKAIGAYPSAREHYREALLISRQTGNRSVEADALRGLGRIAEATGDYPGATRCFHDALNLFRQIGHWEGEAAALLGLGTVALAIGNFQDAKRFYQSALAIAQQIGYRGTEAGALLGRARLAINTGNVSAAESHLHDVLTICRQIRSPSGEASALIYLGRAAGLTGDGESASEHLRNALLIFKQIGDRNGEAAALRFLGNEARADGRRDEARQRWRAALAIYVEIGSPAGKALREELNELDRG